ncbi:hypothetical protein NDU88_000203 [Pleurodeles waltl]|uniref:Uncharacterized protein n=1 Tax=Pleurodeles waltl TaxID=8319 RepID=A0AAV7S6F2_PLEWA|nr:hypothetical protein NDU88_000203 [Pleurodeles waltl]
MVLVGWPGLERCPATKSNNCVPQGARPLWFRWAGLGWSVAQQRRATTMSRKGRVLYGSGGLAWAGALPSNEKQQPYFFDMWSFM